MKIHLAEIPDEGLRRTLQLDLGKMARLGEAIGAQQGTMAAGVRIRNREGNVEIDGVLRATLQAPCQRCLESVPVSIEEPLHVALVPDRQYDAAPADLSLGQGDLEVSFYAGEELDLSHILEDELLLLVPEPVAEEDDDGRCAICGKSLEELMPEGSEDHPFAQLRELMRDD